MNDAVNSRIEQNNINVSIIRNQLNNQNENLSTDIVPYIQHEINNFQNGRVKVVQNENDISSFVEAAKKVPSNAKLYFGKIGANIARRIKQSLGVDLENYNISLSTNAIRHTNKNHGNIQTEANRGQVAVTTEDFKLIPKIVTDFDNVSLSGTTENHNQAILFENQIRDMYYLVSYVSDKNHNLEVKTMWKINTQKKNSAAASDASKPQSQTSETDSGTSSLYNNNSTNQTQSQIAPLPLNIKIITILFMM